MLIGNKDLLYSSDSEYWGLCFTAEEDNVSIKLNKVYNAPDINLQTSIDGVDWTPFRVGIDEIVLTNIGDKVYFAATDEGNLRLSNSNITDYNAFIINKKVLASGDVTSLLDNKQSVIDLTGRDYCFCKLFDNCYLVNAPELPSTTLASYCYASMFHNCQLLTKVPKLPATTLAPYCYLRMFDNCTSLTIAPKLPATTLSSFCYPYMFNGCIKLMTAPLLPATNLDSYCYLNMFSGCTLLNRVEVKFNSWHSNATKSWLSGVSSTGTFICPSELGNKDTIKRGSHRCPDNWTVENIGG